MYGKYLENETFRTSSPNCYFCNFWRDKQTLVKHPFSTVEGKINCLYHSVKALFRLIHFTREKGTLAKIVPKFHFFIHCILLGRTLYQFQSIPVPLSLPAQSLSSQRKKITSALCELWYGGARRSFHTAVTIAPTYLLTYLLITHPRTHLPAHPPNHSLTHLLSYLLSYCYVTLFGPLAQSIERGADKTKVVSSNLTRTKEHYMVLP